MITQITAKEIEALKGKCLRCFNTSHNPDDECDCFDICKSCGLCSGIGQATIEIDKEWVECPNIITELSYHSNCKVCKGKGKISKYKVGEEIIPKLCGNRQLSKAGYCMDCGEFHKLKIISETEDKQRVIEVK